MCGCFKMEEIIQATFHFSFHFTKNTLKPLSGMLKVPSTVASLLKTFKYINNAISKRLISSCIVQLKTPLFPAYYKLH